MQSASQSFFDCGENSGYGRTRLGPATAMSLTALCPDPLCVCVRVVSQCVCVKAFLCVVKAPELPVHPWPSTVCVRCVCFVSRPLSNHPAVWSLWHRDCVRTVVVWTGILRLSPQVTYRSRCEIACNLQWLWWRLVETSSSSKCLESAAAEFGGKRYYAGIS